MANLKALRVVAAVDALNVGALAVISPRHGVAGALGYLPALCGVIVAHTGRSRVPRILCVAGLVPNTVGAVAANDGARDSRLLSWYLGVGGAVIGIGYLLALGPVQGRRRVSGVSPLASTAHHGPGAR